jgi:hypothetical protein
MCCDIPLFCVGVLFVSVILFHILVDCGLMKDPVGPEICNEMYLVIIIQYNTIQ